VDVLLIVADTSRRSLQAAIRIHELAGRLNIGVKKSVLIVNQAKGEPSDIVMKMVEEAGVDFAGCIPEDETLYEFDLEGKATIGLPEDNPAVQAAGAIFEKIMDNQQDRAIT